MGTTAFVTREEQRSGAGLRNGLPRWRVGDCEVLRGIRIQPLFG